MAQSVEHILGKDEVTSSSLVSSSIKSHEKIVGFLFSQIVAYRLLRLIAKSIVFGWLICLLLSVDLGNTASVEGAIALFAGILFAILDTIRVFYFI